MSGNGAPLQGKGLCIVTSGQVNPDGRTKYGHNVSKVQVRVRVRARPPQTAPGVRRPGPRRCVA